MIYFLFRRRTLILFFLPIALLLFAQTSRNDILLALPLLFTGQFLRFWAAGSIVKLRQLADTGAFSLCRNPLYLGSFLIYAGYCIMANNLAVSLSVLLLFLVSHAAAVAYEEKLMCEEFGEEYISYCKKTPRVVPLIRRPIPGKFSFAQMIDNREHVAAALMVTMLALFTLKVII